MTHNKVKPILTFLSNTRRTVMYKNHQGKISLRDLTPEWIWYGTSPYHENKQWFLTAYDHRKQTTRDFALNGFIEAGELIDDKK